MDIVEERNKFLLNKLYNYSFEDVKPVGNIGFAECGYKTEDTIPIDLQFSRYDDKKGWGGICDSHYWFVFDVDVPEDGKIYALSVKTGYTVWHASNPQFIVYLDSKIEQGLDENHTEIVFRKGGRQTVWLYAYTGSETNEKLHLNVSVFRKREDVRRLYFSLEVLGDVIGFSSKNSAEYRRNLDIMTNTLNLIDFNSKTLSETTVANALSYLNSAAVGNNSNETVYCVGQTHIDLEWLWTLKQTKEKVQRSFSNVVNLMKRYKHATFFASTPILYEYIKETQPDLYEEIKAYIAEKRWDVEGATYVECDTVLSGGEALIRQFLYGKDYFKKEFGLDSKILWLPDCFGFSAVIPQIAKQFGIKWLVTSKLSWNDTNIFPHDIFDWQGIDGSVLHTYFLTMQAKTRTGGSPVTVYNGNGSACQVAGTYDRLTEKEISDIVIDSYGWGDGGGGPTEGMLEHIDFMSKGVLGLPRVKNATVTEFFNDLDKKIENKTLPKWLGELYLEYHRGTYTSVGKVKKLNRQTEIKLINAEFLCALNKDYSTSNVISGFWKTLIVHQFHDALPGSGIREVCNEIERDLSDINAKLDDIIDAQIKTISEKERLKGDAVVFNFNSRPVSGFVEVNGSVYYVKDVPAKGYRTVNFTENEIKADIYTSNGVIENAIFRIKFDDNYEITELIDKRLNRNIVKNGKRFNELIAYNDINVCYDNWELSESYVKQSFPINSVVKVQNFSDGINCGVRITRKFRSSTIVQEISLSACDETVKFLTEADWKESDMILRAEFYPDIQSDTAVYDIQFGNIKRSTHNNTSYERAQFEVPFHKYIDYSEGGYGMAVITDSKYGGAVKDGKMSLSLIKSSCYPYKEMDKCKHTFSYALFPHADGLTEKSVADTAYEFNNPLYAVALDTKGQDLKEYSFISCDADNIIIETIKPSEDGRGVIVRFYDYKNSKHIVNFALKKKARKIIECDMSEKEIKILAENSYKFNTLVSNYQIKTVKIL